MTSMVFIVLIIIISIIDYNTNKNQMPNEEREAEEVNRLFGYVFNETKEGGIFQMCNTEINKCLYFLKKEGMAHQIHIKWLFYNYDKDL